MPKKTYKKKIKNGKEYYFYRLRHKNLLKPQDLYGSTVKELEEKIKTLNNELDHGIANNKEFFGTFLKDWLYNTHLVDKKPSTKERYDSIYKNYIDKSDIYTIKLKDLSASDIQDYYKYLISNKKSVAAIKNLHKLIAPCIRYAYDNNRIMKNFSKSIVIPREQEDKIINKDSAVKPLSLKEQMTFLNVIKGLELEMLFITALDKGLRQGELFALTWKDIDLKNCYINVNKSLKRVKNIETEEYEYIVQTPKTGKGIRKVIMPNHLIKILKGHKVSQKVLKIKMSNLYNDNNLVFCNMFGKFLDSSNVNKKFKKMLSEINIKDKKFHNLRHTYATRLFELGEEPKTVQELLGHANVSITLDTYTHVLESMKIKASSKLDDLYNSMRAK